MNTKYDWAIACCFEAEVLLTLAQMDHDNKAYIVEAIDLYQKVLNMKEIEIPHPYLGLAYLSFSTGRIEEAYALLNSAEQIDPTNLDVARLRNEFQKAGQDPLIPVSNVLTKFNQIERLNTVEKTESGGSGHSLGRLFQPIQELFTSPVDVFQFIKTEFDFTLSKEDASFLFDLIRGQNAGDVQADFQKYQAIVSQIDLAFGKNVQAFSRRVLNSPLAKLKKYQTFFRSLKAGISSPKVLHQMIQSAFQQDWNKEDTTAFCHFIQSGTPTGQAAKIPQDLKFIETLLQRLGYAPEQETSLLEITEKFRTHSPSLSQGELQQIQADIKPSTAKVPSPKHIFDWVQKQYQLPLNKPKATAVAHFLNTGYFDGQTPLNPTDLQRLQSLLVEFKLCNQSDLKAKQEWGTAYGALTSAMIQKLVKQYLEHLT